MKRGNVISILVIFVLALAVSLTLVNGGLISSPNKILQISKVPPEPIDSDICEDQCQAYSLSIIEECEATYLNEYKICINTYLDDGDAARQCRQEARVVRDNCIANVEFRTGLCGGMCYFVTNTDNPRGFPPREPPFCAFADWDFDGFVNQNDFDIFIQCFSGPDVPYPPVPFLNCGMLDSDNDNDVDLVDFSNFQICYSGNNFYQGFDDDQDGFPWFEDNCVDDFNPLQEDFDGDFAGDVCDNCLFDPNPEQFDADLDGQGDACDFTATCCFDDFLNDPEGLDNCIPDYPYDICGSEGGYVLECVSQKPDEPKLAPEVNVSHAPVNRTALSGYLQNLTNDVAATGINNTAYTNTYQCMDFSRDLERNLTDLGYNATFTAYWCYWPNGTERTAHAVVDVHPPGGGIIFIEPQTGRIINNDLDFDGDGSVEYRTHHSSPRRDTDDNCEIEVYPSRAAASAAGVPGA